MKKIIFLVKSASASLAFVMLALAPPMSPASAATIAPRFEVDVAWPKPLPNHWILGPTIGVSVDADNHVWIIHRGNLLSITEKQLDLGTGDCCAAAPPVLEFDQAGNLMRSWGGPGEGYEWPTSLHGIFVDYKHNVWIGGNGRDDSEILKFTQDGKFLMQVGKKGARRKDDAPADPSIEGGVAGFAADSSDPSNFGRAAKIFVDQRENEAYIADGYLNRRVAVLDADTGKMKRWWGAYGNKPDDTSLGAYDPAAPPAQQFRNPVHCADMSVDRMIYVCDRVNDRLQIFTPEGKFVKEARFETNTKSDGSVWDIAFSRDPQQNWIFMADGVSEKVKIIDRKTLAEVTTFGDGGHQPGEFYGAHSIAIDLKGNLYVTETYNGRRVQRFIYKGMAPVTKLNQGVVWPKH